MSGQRHRRAVFPGTFDPITNGHLDIIRRGARLFDELVVAVGENPEKGCVLPARRRLAMVRRAVQGEGLRNVRVETYEGLTVDFARRAGADVAVRGLRTSADLHFECPVALTNRQVSGLETVFILPSPAVAFISSTLVRQIAEAGRDVSSLVPASVLAEVRRTYARHGKGRPARPAKKTRRQERGP